MRKSAGLQEIYSFQEHPFTSERKAQLRGVLREHAAALGKTYDENDQRVLMVHDGATFVGGVSFACLWTSMYIKQLAIAPPYRGQGVGTALVQQVVALAEQAKCHFITVETMGFQAVGFYEKMGFVTEFVRDYAPGKALYYMKKTLTA